MSADAVLTGIGIATQPEIGIPLAIVTHPKFTAELVLISMMSVMIVIAIGAYLLTMTTISTLAMLGAGVCLLFVIMLRRKRPKVQRPKAQRHQPGN